MRPRFDPERLALMQRMYEQGYSLKTVGEVFCLSDIGVLYLFKRYGIPRHKRGYHSMKKAKK